MYNAAKFLQPRETFRENYSFKQQKRKETINLTSPFCLSMILQLRSIFERGCEFHRNPSALPLLFKEAVRLI